MSCRQIVPGVCRKRALRREVDDPGTDADGPGPRRLWRRDRRGTGSHEQDEHDGSVVSVGQRPPSDWPGRAPGIPRVAVRVSRGSNARHGPPLSLEKLIAGSHLSLPRHWHCNRCSARHCNGCAREIRRTNRSLPGPWSLPHHTIAGALLRARSRWRRPGLQFDSRAGRDGADRSLHRAG